MGDYNADLHADMVENTTSRSGTSVLQPVPIASPSGAIHAEGPTTVASSQGFRSTWRPYAELSQEVKLQLTQDIQRSNSFEVKPSHVKQEYEKQRTRAMHDALQTRFFKGSTSILTGYQALCRAVRIEPPDTIKKCRRNLRGTLVNIVDLLEALDFDEPVKVWPREDWDAFAAYTREPENCFDLKEAKKSEYLKCFLQKLARKGPRRVGNPRPLRMSVKARVLNSALSSPPHNAEVKEEAPFEGLGRLSPLASECVYDQDDDPSPATVRSRKRGFRDVENGILGEEFGKKRSRLVSVRQSITTGTYFRASEEPSFEDFDDTIPSGQGDESA
ncbi:hypothetical protein N0V93_008733 [Gnomoniopsis smithogilvyi]|uniref:Uncharacterized protein n=1 Tax=Gnomoniopsis smithogilvyi TaxID=1191159 RepID=A0A9W9CV23_9PEZI|nr:hypothetical protein N0V93_008733 [Gnomoniopsis smithogilvyi]